MKPQIPILGKEKEAAIQATGRQIAEGCPYQYICDTNRRGIIPSAWVQRVHVTSGAKRMVRVMPKPGYIRPYRDLPHWPEHLADVSRPEKPPAGPSSSGWLGRQKTPSPRTTQTRPPHRDVSSSPMKVQREIPGRPVDLMGPFAETENHNVYRSTL